MNLGDVSFLFKAETAGAQANVEKFGATVGNVMGKVEKDIAGGVGGGGALAAAHKESGGLFGGIANTLGTIGLAASGITVLGDTIKGLMGDAIDAQKVQSQLNSVLASTHGVSGMTADSVNALSDSLSRVTPFEDEAIGSAQNMLLTFTSIGKDVFPGATEAVLNMSQALGQDLQSSAIQLGKALNDPITGATALRRVGVALSDQQQQSIKDFMAQNNIMGAQNIILKELQTEFGGAARAAGETFAGKMSILNTQIGNVKEAIGGPLLSVLSGLLSGLLPVITSFATGLPDAITQTSNTIRSYLQPALDTVENFLGYLDPGNSFDLMRFWFGGDIGPRIDTIVRSFRAFGSAVVDIAPKIVTFGKNVLAALGDFIHGGNIEDLLATLNDYFVDAFDISPGEVLTGLGNLGLSLVGWVTDEAFVLELQLAQWERAFIDWVAPMIPQAISALADLGGRIVGWVVAEVPILRDRLGTWAQGWIDWIAPLIPRFIGEFNRLATQWLDWIKAEPRVIGDAIATWAQPWIAWIAPLIPRFIAEFNRLVGEWGAWIQAQAAVILAQVSAWANSFIAWIPGATVTFLKQWPGMLNQFLDWIEVSAGPILKQLADWAAAFINFIGPKIPDILLAMGAVTLAIVTFILETAVTIADRLLKWGLAFVEWVIPQIPILIKNLGTLSASVAQWIHDQGITLGNLAYEWGRGVISRFLDGLHSMSLNDLANLALPTPGSPVYNLVNPPASSTPAVSPSSGVGPTGLGNNGLNVNVNINGSNVNGNDARTGAEAGVRSVARSMGYN